jgi:hypothetical protein
MIIGGIEEMFEKNLKKLKFHFRLPMLITESFNQEGKMTVTPYQVNSVLTAYAKQSKLKVSHTIPLENAPDGKYADVVSLSVKEDNKAEEFDKISYNLRDVILSDNDT